MVSPCGYCGSASRLSFAGSVWPPQARPFITAPTDASLASAVATVLLHSPEGKWRRVVSVSAPRCAVARHWWLC